MYLGDNLRMLEVFGRLSSNTGCSTQVFIRLSLNMGCSTQVFGRLSLNSGCSTQVFGRIVFEFGMSHSSIWKIVFDHGMFHSRLEEGAHDDSPAHEHGKSGICAVFVIECFECQHLLNYLLLFKNPLLHSLVVDSKACTCTHVYPPTDDGRCSVHEDTGFAK